MYYGAGLLNEYHEYLALFCTSKDFLRETGKCSFSRNCSLFYLDCNKKSVKTIQNLAKAEIPQFDFLCDCDLLNDHKTDHNLFSKLNLEEKKSEGVEAKSCLQLLGIHRNLLTKAETSCFLPYCELLFPYLQSLP